MLDLVGNLQIHLLYLLHLSLQVSRHNLLRSRLRSRRCNLRYNHLLSLLINRCLVRRCSQVPNRRRNLPAALLHSHHHNLLRNHLLSRRFSRQCSLLHYPHAILLRNPRGNHRDSHFCSLHLSLQDNPHISLHLILLCSHLLSHLHNPLLFPLANLPLSL